MKKEKIISLLSGLLIVILGFLVAIFGAAAVLNLYFGIAACIAGVCLLAFSLVLMSKRTVVPPSNLIGGSALTAVGIGLLCGMINAGVLISLLEFAVLGGGVGLVIFGVYMICKKATRLGIFNIIVGAASLTLAILVLAVNGFAKAFWIIVGILIAAYGIYQIVTVAIKSRAD